MSVPSIDHMSWLKVMSEKVLNNLPLFMFGLLMFVTLAMVAVEVDSSPVIVSVATGTAPPLFIVITVSSPESSCQ